jgi:methionyl-tRNA formyltransferase
MTFGEINKIILMGGSRCTAELAQYLKEKDGFEFHVFTAPRQLKDIIYSDGGTFEEFLIKNQINYTVCEDINTEKKFIQNISTNTLGIGLGEAWSFSKEIIAMFDGRLLDLMGIRLPQYRGGAHYTWQILRGSRIGACNLQVVNEFMVQGVFDSGEVIKFKEYFFPSSARIPMDYFNHAVNEEIGFIKEFIDEVKSNKTFHPFVLQENFSIYFPRLNTIKNAFIDWTWDTNNIDRFICAFDDPYIGASTMLNGELVRLKKSRVEYNDGNFHPFQKGLVYKIYGGFLYVATLNGTIIVENVYNEKGEEISHNIRTGDRFFTPNGWIEKGLTSKIIY